MKMIVNIKNVLNNPYICRGGGVLFLINKGLTRIFKDMKDYEITSRNTRDFS